MDLELVRIAACAFLIVNSCHVLQVFMNDDRRHSILAVEDNQDAQLLLRYLLRALYDMSIVSTIDEAVDIAQEESFDIYLLDINLGERRTGVELLQLLRALNGQYVPALALTAYALPGDKERFLEAGFDGYMS
jgi:CheY-like chemotaxis protein